MKIEEGLNVCEDEIEELELELYEGVDEDDLAELEEEELEEQDLVVVGMAKTAFATAVVVELETSALEGPTAAPRWGVVSKVFLGATVELDIETVGNDIINLPEFY